MAVEETHMQNREGAENEIRSLNSVLQQLQIKHAECVAKLEQFDRENNGLLNRSEDKDKKVKELSKKYGDLHAQMTEKDRLHSEAIKLLKSEKAALEAQLRQANAHHEDANKARDVHAAELARHRRDMVEKDNYVLIFIDICIISFYIYLNKLIKNES